MSTRSIFKAVYGDARLKRDFLQFLTEIYHLYPEKAFHALIERETAKHDSDEAIYRGILANLKSIEPFLAPIRYALPSLWKQKKVMTRQTLEIIDTHKPIHGYVEVGSTGRYISKLRKAVHVDGEITLVNDVAPTNSVTDIAERGGFAKIGRFVSLNDYDAITGVPSNSVDLVTCFIGLHHAPLEKREAFIRSIHAMLRPGGLFLLRDHDVETNLMADFVSLAHTVFNAGLKIDWEIEAKDFKSFDTADGWSGTITALGFEDLRHRILQKNDPTLNTLMAFRKR